MRIIFSNTIILLLTLLGAAVVSAQENSAATDKAANIEALMNHGRQLVQEGSFDEALPIFEEVIKQDDLNAEALYHAGNIYLRRNQVPKGIEYIERSVQLVPANVSLRFALAQTYENALLSDKALEEYRKLADTVPDTPQGKESSKRARILLGRQYGEQAKFDQALLAFSSVLADYPGDVPTLIDEGLTYFFMGRLDEAESIFRNALTLQPNNGLIHKYLGDVFEKKGDPERSAEQYMAAQKLLPLSSPLNRIIGVKLALIRGSQLMNSGQKVEAEQEFENVLALDPHNPAARFNLAIIYRELGDLVRAEQMLRSLSEENPGDLLVELRLGTLYLEQGNIEAATRLFEDVVAKGGGGPQAQHAAKLLEDIHAEAEKLSSQPVSNAEIIASYRSMIEENPDDLKAWTVLGQIYLQLRRNDEAIEAFENIVRLDTIDVQALFILGGLYDDTNMADKAIESFNRALDLAQDPVLKQRVGSRLIMALARKAFSENSLDEAEREFRAIIELEEDNFAAHFYLGAIYHRDGRLEGAISEYQNVLRIVPGHAPARLNLASLYEQVGNEEQAIAEYRTVAIAALPDLSDSANKRLESLKKRVAGFSYNIGYTVGFDSNSNLSPTNPTQETRSDISGSVSYQRKVRGKKLYWGVRVSPVYSIYHQQQFDFLQMDVSPSVNGVWRDLNLSVNYSFSQTDGVQVEQHYNTSQNVYAEVFRRINLMSLVPFLSSDEQRKSAPSVWRINGAYRSFRTETTSYSDSDSFTLGALLSQSGDAGWSWTGVYTFTNNQNVLSIGNDFAYISHGVNLQLSKSISPRLSANGAYNFTYSLYKNPDSVTSFTERRINKSNALSLGGNYSINESLRLFMSFVYQRNFSNLPTGFILSTADVGTAVGIQSPSLGDYSKYGITTGLSLNF